MTNYLPYVVEGQELSASWFNRLVALVNGFSGNAPVPPASLPLPPPMTEQSAATDPYVNPESISVGGYSNYSGTFTVRGAPYGYYDTGTAFSLVGADLPLSSSRAGVNGGFEQGVPAMAAYAGRDSVMMYVQGQSNSPSLTLNGATYTATRIIPSVPLSAVQIAQLRKSMWVGTNSIDASISTSHPIGTLPVDNRYATTITGWATDGSYITVSGWCVPGAGNAAANQVPPNAAGGNIAWFGAPDKVFAHNWVLRHDPNNNLGTQSYQYEGLELDIQDYGTVDYQGSFRGLTLVYSPFGGAKPTTDSWGLHINGQWPTALKLRNGVPGAVAIDADAMLLNVSASPAPAVSSAAVVVDYQNFIDSNRMRLTTYLVRDSEGGGWPSASLHVGLQIDGSIGALNGSLQGEIVYNPPGNDSGSISLRGGSGVYGLTVDYDGDVVPGKFMRAASPAPATGSKSIVQDNSCYIDTNQMRLVQYGVRDTTGGGWPTSSYHVGLQIDGTFGALDGSQMGEVVFNPPSFPGAVGLRGSAGSYGAIVSSSATVYLPVVQASTSYANDTAAAVGGVGIGQIYRNGSQLMIRVS